jgi:hypothetical protein
MKHVLKAGFLVAALSGCGITQAQIQAAAASPAGQLFCAIQTNGGGALVVGLIDAEASAISPASEPVAVIATGATKTYVDNACAAAGGIAVSPPANPSSAPSVAVVVPKA